MKHYSKAKQIAVTLASWPICYGVFLATGGIPIYIYTFMFVCIWYLRIWTSTYAYKYIYFTDFDGQFMHTLQTSWITKPLSQCKYV